MLTTSGYQDKQIFTAAQRRSLGRICGSYLEFTNDESPFTISDAISIAILLTQTIQQTKRNEKMIQYYKAAYSSLCGALKIPNPEILLLRLRNRDSTENWSDFSDFKAVWYPKWFAAQMELREKIFSFVDEKNEEEIPDFWGVTCSDAQVKKDLVAVKDSFSQIRIGALAIVLKIDFAIAALFGWPSHLSVAFDSLKTTYRFPQL